MTIILTVKMRVHPCEGESITLHTQTHTHTITPATHTHGSSNPRPTARKCKRKRQGLRSVCRGQGRMFVKPPGPAHLSGCIMGRYLIGSGEGREVGLIGGSTRGYGSQSISAARISRRCSARREGQSVCLLPHTHTHAHVRVKNVCKARKLTSSYSGYARGKHT